MTSCQACQTRIVGGEAVSPACQGICTSLEDLENTEFSILHLQMTCCCMPTVKGHIGCIFLCG